MHALASFNWGLPAQASTYAPAIDWGIGLIHWVMLLMFALWGGFMLWCLIRFRRAPGVPAVYAEMSHTTAMIPDIAVVIFEITLIAVYGLPRWTEMKQHVPADADCAVVRVVAEQFAWNVQYAGPDGKFGRTDAAMATMNNPLGLDRADPAAKDDIFAMNEVHAPLGKKVLIYLTSKDVIHDFFVPEFRMKQDVVPGLRIPLWFEPTAAGTYEIGCAQLCGIAHYAMRGDFVVETPKEFNAWLKAQAKLDAI